MTLQKDLILDLNPIGQLAGLGPQVALVTTYESQPIVSEMKGTATGFPLSVRWTSRAKAKSTRREIV